LNEAELRVSLHDDRISHVDLSSGEALSTAVSALREFGVVALTGVPLEQAIPTAEASIDSDAWFPQLAHPFMTRLADGVLGRQFFEMDKAELDTKVVPPSLFTDGRRIQNLPWEMQEVRHTGHAGEEEEQAWVRSEDLGPAGFDFHGIFDHQLEVYWSLSAEESTCVEVIPRSHRWPRHRRPTQQQGSKWKTVQPGEALIFLGATLHRQEPMQGKALHVGYQTAYLSQRCNLYLAVPPARALAYPVSIQRLLGYSMPGPILNKIYLGAPDTVHDGPLRAWEAYGDRAVDWAGPAKDQPHAAAMEALTTPLPSGDHLHVGNLSSWVRDLPPLARGGSLVAVEADDPDAGSKLLAALLRDGGAVLSHGVSLEVCEAFLEDLKHYSDDVNGATVGAVVARSSASWPMVAHPVVMRVCDAVLGRQALRMTPERLQQQHRTTEEEGLPYQLHVNLTIPKQAGGPRQALHRDGDLSLIGVASLCGVDHAISCIWAVDGDFSEERGTTRVVLGSHEWPTARTPFPEESIAAEMPRGSCFLYTGRTLHGAGHNQTEGPRLALNVAYNSRCLKQEENTSVSIPAGTARGFPAAVHRLLPV